MWWLDGESERLLDLDFLLDLEDVEGDEETSDAPRWNAIAALLFWRTENIVGTLACVVEG